MGIRVEPPTRTTYKTRQWDSQCPVKGTYFVDILLSETSVLENLLDRLHGLPEQVHVQLLELGPGQRLGEVVAALEGFDFNPGGLLGRQIPLSLLDLPLQPAHSPGVLGNVGARLLLVELDKVVDDTVVKVFTTKVGITSNGQDHKDTFIDEEKRDIETSTTEIVDDDPGSTIPLVETVGDGGSCGLVDDTEDLETGNGTGVHGGVTLSIVEVGGNGNDGVGNLLSKVSLGNLLHLDQDHGGYFFGGEIPLLTTVLDRNGGLSVLLDDLEWPV